MKQIKKFTIKRSKWCRGEDEPMLLRSRDQKMCCLGFFALALGGTEEEIEDQIEPQCIPTPECFRWPKWMNVNTGRPEGVCGALMDTNDAKNLTEEEREEKISKLFKEQGIKVHFED